MQAVGLNVPPSRECCVIVKDEPGVVGLVEGDDTVEKYE